jgi:hypothetical protein
MDSDFRARPADETIAGARIEGESAVILEIDHEKFDRGDRLRFNLTHRTAA